MVSINQSMNEAKQTP